MGHCSSARASAPPERGAHHQRREPNHHRQRLVSLVRARLRRVAQTTSGRMVKCRAEEALYSPILREWGLAAIFISHSRRSTRGAKTRGIFYKSSWSPLVVWAWHNSAEREHTAPWAPRLSNQQLSRMTLLWACQALGTKSLFTKGGGGGSYLQTMNYSGIGVKLGKELLTKKWKRNTRKNPNISSWHF